VTTTAPGAEVDRRADGVAQHLLDAGLERQQAFAQYLYNGNEYMESMYAAFKGAFVPVNTNYRYTADELLYLWDNADAGAVVFHGCSPTRRGHQRPAADGQGVAVVDDASGPCPDWATPYEQVATSGAGRVAPAWGRSGDDLNMLYTGGTTGMPKGVMWRQDDLAVKLSATLGTPLTDDGTVDDLKRHVHRARRPVPARLSADARHRQLPRPEHADLRRQHRHPHRPHLRRGRTARHDRTVRGVNSLAIVGDAFAKPILRVLDENRGKLGPLVALLAIVSSGVMWSQETKTACSSIIPAWC
jgi:3-oxocholest-4-en-26-oate---CoA ligase